MATTTTNNIIDFVRNLIIPLLTILAALYFGWCQITINRRLKNLQDFVGVSLIPGKEYIEEIKNGEVKKIGINFYFKFLNVGKINIYLHKVEIISKKSGIPVSDGDILNPPRLLPVGTLDSGFYWYPIPNNLPNEFNIKLFLTDEFGKKWISEHGGGSENNRVTMWSYKTYKKKWSIL